MTYGSHMSSSLVFFSPEQLWPEQRSPRSCQDPPSGDTPALGHAVGARRAWTRHLGSSNHQGSPSREEAAEPHWQAAHDSELDEEERGQERQQRIEEEKQQGVVEEDHCEQTRTTIATAHASSRTYPNVMASGCTREGVAEEQCRGEGGCWLVVAAATAAGSMVMVGPGRANGGERGTWVGERRFG